MSVKTWMEEFYIKPKKNMSKLEAIEQSLKKYEGITAKNLAKHKVEMDGNYLVDATATSEEDDFCFDVDTCALCKKYFNRRAVGYGCSNCPLGQAGKDCFKETGPFEKFMAGDSRPMRAALRSLLKKEQGRIK